ncbi:hypothetical protein HanIR_Chr02g0085971 [Helianthus annuus]|nr:hypothetical protein HanIR_Chr02g0085971 [Helianthus annuus]
MYTKFTIPIIFGTNLVPTFWRFQNRYFRFDTGLAPYLYLLIFNFKYHTIPYHTISYRTELFRCRYLISMIFPDRYSRCRYRYRVIQILTC